MKKFRLKVWGDFACFTRPEMKVERVSYDVMTPSAARAIFEAILWKPEIEWHIERIDILNPIKWINLRRNELDNCKCGKNSTGIFVEEKRVQRAGLFLKDVSYVIQGHFTLKECAEQNNTAKKYEEMFVRRASQGQCFMQPYLGCREFAAHFELVKDDETLQPLASLNLDMGWMLFDLDFSQNEISPKFFKASIQEGILNIPAKNSAEVKG
ncbi:MAG: type I-C CRISPR-associated protein Cas5c [Parachlamydiaceae bacterium]